jgi:hypothetical protein
MTADDSSGYLDGVKTLATVLLLAGLLCAAAPAQASDRSVRRAWNADDAKFKRHGERVGTYYLRWERSGYERKGPLLEELAATRRTLDGTRAAVRAEPASSKPGARARYWALRSMRAFDEDLATQHRAVRARSAGRRARARRLFADAEEDMTRSFRFARRAKRLFREALS